jgi:hypothetical protein
MYSYEERMRAINLYIKYDLSTKPTTSWSGLDMRFHTL